MDRGPQLSPLISGEQLICPRNTRTFVALLLESKDKLLAWTKQQSGQKSKW